MSAVNELYQQVILDHNHCPRNCHKMQCPSNCAEGYNPLCGDRLTVYLSLNKGIIEDISFEGNGCAISKASASMMTASLKGKSLQEALKISDEFRRMVTGDETIDPEDLGKLAVFSGVSEFPARVKCATLAWHTLQAALQPRNEVQPQQPVVTTEDGIR